VIYGGHSNFVMIITITMIAMTTIRLLMIDYLMMLL